MLAFKRELLTAAPHDADHYVQLYRDDRAQFDEALQAAWQARRFGPFIRMCRVLEMNGEMSGKSALRLARLLSNIGPFREAVELATDPRFGLERHPIGQLSLARSWLALGQADRARAALAKAVEYDAGVQDEAAEIERNVAAVVAATQAAQASPRWSETRRLIDQYLEIGAADAAAGSLNAFLRRGEVERGELPDVHEALDTILSLTAPEGACNLFRALERFYPGEDERADLRLICAMLSGEIEPARPWAWRSSGRDLRASGATAWARAGKLEAAIPALGGLTLEFPKDMAIGAALARAVGEDLLSRHPLRLAPGRRGPRKIFDVFPFNNELRMLKVKLHEMAAWVDHFVIVEARQTFTGVEKPLVFSENRAEFSAFDDKIVHVVVDAFPPHAQHAWAREYYQRDSGLLGLSGLCAEDDLVIISDVDEVISGDVVRAFQGEYARLRMQRSRFFLNYREVLEPDAQDVKPLIWRGAYLPRFGLSYARAILPVHKKSPQLVQAGWHFTSMFDSAGIAQKYRSVSHQEYASIPESEIAATLKRIRLGAPEPGWERCEVDGRFPAYIREHQSEFADLLL